MDQGGTGRSGDAGSQLVEQVLSAHGAALHRFCLARTSHPSDADDAMQETLLHFVRHARGERIENPEAWLVAVAARVCLRMAQRRARFAGHEPEPFDAEEDPADTVVERAWVEKILADLQFDDRALLTSLYMRDQAPADVAEAMGRPEGTVRWLAHRARARARAVALRLGGAGATTLALLMGWAARRAGGRTALRSRLAGAVAHPSVTSITAGPALLLIIAGTSGLLGPGLATAPQAGATRSGAVTVAAAPAARGLRVDGGDREAVVLPPAVPGRTAVQPGPPRTTPPPGYVDPPLTDYVLPSPDPHDAIIYGSSASPTYESDHTLFAWGWPMYCTECLNEVLYRSRDGGHTWTLRAAIDYLGGEILMPFDYDRTHTIFAVANGGLWRSDDDGNVFTMALPLQVDGGAALVPAADGDSVVVIGGQPPLRYDERTRRVSTGPRYPDISDTEELAYAGTRLLVHGYRASLAQDAGIDSSPSTSTCSPAIPAARRATACSSVAMGRSPSHPRTSGITRSSSSAEASSHRWSCRRTSVTASDRWPCRPSRREPGHASGRTSTVAARWPSPSRVAGRVTTTGFTWPWPTSAPAGSPASSAAA